MVGQAVPDLDRRGISTIEPGSGGGIKVVVTDGESFTSRHWSVATGISAFASRPAEFETIPPALASHSGEHNDLLKFKGQSIAVIGAGQSALESAALLKEAGIAVEVIARQRILELGRIASSIASFGTHISNTLFDKRRRSSWDKPSGGSSTYIQ